MPKSVIREVTSKRIEFINNNPGLTIRQIARALKISYMQSWRLVHGYGGHAGQIIVRKSKLPYNRERKKREPVLISQKKMFNLNERGNWMI